MLLELADFHSKLITWLDQVGKAISHFFRIIKKSQKIKNIKMLFKSFENQKELRDYPHLNKFLDYLI